jgi:predicted nucleic acid-binding protein
MTYLIDSDILISAAIGRQDAQDLINDATQYGATVSVISLGEVYEGAVDGLRGEDRTKLDYLRRFLHAFPILILIHLDTGMLPPWRVGA